MVLFSSATALSSLSNISEKSMSEKQKLKHYLKIRSRCRKVDGGKTSPNSGFLSFRGKQTLKTCLFSKKKLENL